MYFRRRHLLVLGGAATLAIAVGVLGGAATKGRAAVNQQVTATIVCEPTTAPHGSSTGCLLTVTNNGVNSANSVTVTDTLPVGAAFLNTSDPRCVISDVGTGDDDRVLTCTIGKLAGMTSFKETHELQLPSSSPGDVVVQTITGRFSQKPNSRGNDEIEQVTTSTSLDTNANFDARWANANAESVHTVSPPALDNPYSALARVFGTTTFATGLSVKDDVGETVGGPSPCPSGCLGGSKVEFHVSPPSGLYPTTFEFEISIDGDGADVDPGTKAQDLTIYHVTPQGTFVTQSCGAPVATDPTGDCVDTLTVENGTWDVFVRIVGPGTGNGPWGVG